MRPQRADIAAPELPQRVRWLGARPPSMAELVAAGPVLIHFFDFAQLNSVRALPYVRAWHERYADLGLTVLGVHSPRFPFTATHEALAAAVERLGIPYRVAQDSSYAIWHDYGVKGWPSLFLWNTAGALAFVHFGEGEYAATEEAIRAELPRADAPRGLPEPMAPLRPSDAPGALVAPPSEELFPGGGPAVPWRPGTPDEPLELEYEAGGAYAAVDGAGELRVSLDGGAEQPIRVAGPGLHALAEHARHERHALRLGADPGVELYSIAFAAAPP
jgi:hypothetical protein